MPFKAEGVPLATCLIAVDHALLETVRITFSTLNTSNQGRHIKVIFFFNIRFDEPDVFLEFNRAYERQMTDDP